MGDRPLGVRKFAVLILLCATQGDLFTGKGGAEEVTLSTQTRWIDTREIHESSGLTAARGGSSWLFTHNDSGDQARVFAIDGDGHACGQWQIDGLQPLDWEDMASVQWHGQPALLLADTGDNQEARTSYQLHVLTEPTSANQPMKRLATIDFHYTDGPHNCEAIAVDETDHTVLLIAKQLAFRSQVFALALPQDGQVAKKLIAEPIGTVPGPFTTGAAISPRGNQLAVMNYAAIYLYTRRAGDSWQQTLRSAPHHIAAPKLKQGEAICFSADGTALYLTSEHCPTPLIRCELPHPLHPSPPPTR